MYDTGYTYSNDEERQQVLVDYRTGDIHVPKVSTTEALLNMANDFISCLQEVKQPQSSCYPGRSVVQILEASIQSMTNQGREEAAETRSKAVIGNSQNKSVKLRRQ